MFYHKILKTWVIDLIDYFLISAFVGSIVASELKKYSSEKEAMKRLKVSVLKKSRLMPKSSRGMLLDKESRIKKIYKLALMPRGGIDDITKHEFSNEIFKLAGDVKNLIERLLSFCAERELKGMAKIFFKSGRLIIELILIKCNIELDYEFLIAGSSVQVIVMTSIVGGAAGFTWSWFSAGGMLIAPPVLLGTLISRSIIQQVINYRESKKFKDVVLKMLEDKEVKERLRIIFVDDERITPSVYGVEMQSLQENMRSKYDFKTVENSEQLIKSIMEKNLGLVENPTDIEIEEIIKRPRKKVRAKTVYYGEFIERNQNKVANENIVDAEFIKESIGNKDSVKGM